MEPDMSFSPTKKPGIHADYPLDYQVTYDSMTDMVAISPLILSDYSRYWCWQSVSTGRVYPVDYTGRTESGLSGYPLASFSRRDNRNHRRYCINVTARSISKDSYRFLRNLEENTDGGDNLFTPNPGEIAGNLRCESNPERTVLGYALFSFATSKRAFLDSRYLKPSPPAALDYPLANFYTGLWKIGYLPLVENKPGYDPKVEGPYGWGPRRCYDCTAAGGTKTKPDDWDEIEADND